MPENQTQANQAGAAANTQGAVHDAAERVETEDRSFADRPSDTEAVHQPDGAHSIRDPRLVQGEDGRRDDARTSSQAQETDDTSIAVQGDLGTTYDPSTVEVNRAREQGDGMGQKDLDMQRDPNRGDTTDQY